MTRKLVLFLVFAVAVLMTAACETNGNSRRNTQRPTLIPEAEAPLTTDSSQVPATFTPAAAPAVIEIEAAPVVETAVPEIQPTAVDQLPLPTSTAVPTPTQATLQGLSSETGQLFNELDDLMNQIDQDLGSDDLSDLP